jgi:hypothetical protein
MIEETTGTSYTERNHNGIWNVMQININNVGADEK